MTTATKVNLNRILRIEDSRLKDIHSVDSYIEELQWAGSLIAYHISRCNGWKRNGQKGKAAYGKLNDFLQEIEDGGHQP